MDNQQETNPLELMGYGVGILLFLAFLFYGDVMRTILVIGFCVGVLYIGFLIYQKLSENKQALAAKAQMDSIYQNMENFESEIKAKKAILELQESIDEYKLILKHMSKELDRYKNAEAEASFDKEFNELEDATPAESTTTDKEGEY